MVGFLFHRPDFVRVDQSLGYPAKSTAVPTADLEDVLSRLVCEIGGLHLDRQLAAWRFHEEFPSRLLFGRVWESKGPTQRLGVRRMDCLSAVYKHQTPTYTVRFGVTLLFPHFQL